MIVRGEFRTGVITMAPIGTIWTDRVRDPSSNPTSTTVFVVLFAIKFVLPEISETMSITPVRLALHEPDEAGYAGTISRMNSGDKHSSPSSVNRTVKLLRENSSMHAG